MTWKYSAIRLNGDGTQTPLHRELPLSDPRIVSTLSGPDRITAVIKPEVAGMLDGDGQLIFVPWSTLIIAEKDGYIRGGGILDEPSEEGSVLKLDCVGPSGYAKDMPYTSVLSRVGVDPMEIVEHIWVHLQGESGGDLGLRVERNSSPVRVGTPERDVNFTAGGGQDVAFTSGPYTLNPWTSHDLGAEIDSLAKETPFQYRTSWKWVGDAAVPTVEYRYPSLGRRVTDARFVLGENIFELPTLDHSGGGYASDVLVLGAGSGREMVIASDGVSTKTRLRRVAVIEDKSITSRPRAKALATSELQRLTGPVGVSDFTISDHPNAPIGSYSAGDEILVSVSGGWSQDMDIWCKVLSLEINPVSGVTFARVTRAERIR